MTPAATMDAPIPPNRGTTSAIIMILAPLVLLGVCLLSKFGYIVVPNGARGALIVPPC